VLTTGQIQTLEYLKNKGIIISQSQPNAQPEAEPENNPKVQYHNLEKRKEDLLNHFSIDRQQEITTSYTDNDNENEKESIINKSYKKSIPTLSCLILTKNKNAGR